MAYKQKHNRPVVEGGTERSSLTAYSVIVAGISGNDELQEAAPGISNRVLISNGSGSPPSFQTVPIAQMNFQVLASDPSFPEDGQVWYRSDTDVYKGSKVVSTWTAKNAMNTARSQVGGAGTAADALSFGGFTTVNVATTERWDGTNWTSKNNLNTARRGLAGAGTAGAALSFGGYIAAASAVTELFDGTNWTSKGSMNTARRLLGGCGTTTDALSFGGLESTLKTERYTGGGTDSWTAKANLNTARYDNAGCGTATDALTFGGESGGATASTELYEGVGNSWTAKANMNTARTGLSGAGVTSNALSFGGGAYLTTTEEYNLVDNAWSAKTGMNTARNRLGGAGSILAALSFGGNTGSVSAVTELYDGIDIVTFTVT